MFPFVLSMVYTVHALSWMKFYFFCSHGKRCSCNLLSAPGNIYQPTATQQSVLPHMPAGNLIVGLREDGFMSELLTLYWPGFVTAVE